MRLIDADVCDVKLKQDLMNNRIGFGKWYDIKQFLKDIPTIEAEPTRHGRWIGKPTAGYSTVKCSVCGDVFLENNGKWNYCPSCGAKME